MKHLTTQDIQEAADLLTIHTYNSVIEDMPAFSSELESASGFQAGVIAGIKWAINELNEDKLKRESKLYPLTKISNNGENPPDKSHRVMEELPGYLKVTWNRENNNFKICPSLVKKAIIEFKGDDIIDDEYKTFEYAVDWAIKKLKL